MEKKFYQGRIVWSKPVLCFLCFLLAIGLGACGKKQPPDDIRRASEPHTKLIAQMPVTTVTVYYTTTDFINLAPLTVSVNETKEGAFVAVTKLLAGAPNQFVASPFPEGIKLVDLYAQNDTVYVELTAQILKLEKKKAAIALQSMAASLAQYVPDAVTNMAVVVDGKTQAKISGQNMPLSLGAVNYYPKGGSPQATDPLLMVYFSDNQAMYLVPVTQKTKGTNLPLEALQALAAGPPSGSGLSAVFWKGTKINGLTIDKGVATVDFSKELLDYGGGSAFESMMLNSLLATLTQFAEINSVQILVSGNKLDYLPEGSVVQGPLLPAKVLNLVR